MSTPILSNDLKLKYVIEAGLKKAHAQDWYVKWRGVVRNAKHRDVECELTFKQYLRLAVKAGLAKPSQIGMANVQYNLARKGDKGGYKVGNCRFITSKQNRDERALNGCFDAYAAEMRTRNKDNSQHYRLISEARKAWYKDPKNIKRNKLAHSKRFRLVSPRGRVYEGTNLFDFCKKKGLAHSSMAQICSRRKESILGWTGTYLEK